MKQGWEIKKLGEVCKFSQGIQVPIEEQHTTCKDGMIRFLRIIDFTQNGEVPRYISNVDDRYILHDKEIAIVRYGTPGYVCYGKKGAIANNLFKILPKKDVFDFGFLKYWLSSEAFQGVVKGKQYGAALQAIKFSTINEIFVPIPPLAVQEKIVAELDCLSGIIEKKKQQLKEYDTLAQSIFYEMFGNPIDNEKRWEVKKLGEEFEISSGGTPETKNTLYWENGDISWIGSNMCQNDIIYQNDGKYITNEGLEHSSAKMYQDGYVIVALVGATIGKTALLKFPTTTNQNVAGINVPSNRNYTSEYVFYLIQNLYGLFQSIGNGKFKMANLSFIRSLPLIVPPLSLQQEFASKIEAIEKQKELIKQSIAETETLFNSRMDFYFN